jgi:hypothetical protein
LALEITKKHIFIIFSKKSNIRKNCSAFGEVIFRQGTRYDFFANAMAAFLAGFERIFNYVRGLGRDFDFMRIYVAWRQNAEM